MISHSQGDAAWHREQRGIKTPDQLRLEAAEKLVEQLNTALLNTSQMDVKGHALIDRLQFSIKGRELMNQINDALAAAKQFMEGK